MNLDRFKDKIAVALAQLEEEINSNTLPHEMIEDDWISELIDILAADGESSRRATRDN